MPESPSIEPRNEARSHEPGLPGRPRDQIKEFETSVVEAARGFNNDYAFDFNGPWPPHNFVNVELKLS